jgi:hypothetical protein
MVLVLRVHVTNGCMDRVRPGTLRPYITHEDWIHFANDVDTAVWPFRRFIRLRSTIPAIGFPGFLFGVIIIVKDSINMSSSSGGDFGRGPPLLGFMVCIASIGFMVLAMIGLNMYRTAGLESQVKQSLENVLQQFSDSNHQRGGRLTAHLIQQQQHDATVIVYHGGGVGEDGIHHRLFALTGSYVLEISILDDNDRHHHKDRQSASSYPCLEEQQQQPTRPIETTTTAMTVRDRLERLEQLRDALSNEEYQEHRRIILEEL